MGTGPRRVFNFLILVCRSDKATDEFGKGPWGRRREIKKTGTAERPTL
jgi:hypothetical protein